MLAKHQLVFETPELTYFCNAKYEENIYTLDHAHLGGRKCVLVMRHLCYRASSLQPTKYPSAHFINK